MLDFKYKLNKIYDYLDLHKFDGMIIGRRDTYSWITNGQESGVILNTDLGFVYLVITKEQRWAVALRADIDKAMNEQLADMGFESCTLDWSSMGKERYAMELLKNKRVVSDISIEGAFMDVNGIYQLQYPMTANEILKYRELGRVCDEILFETASEITYGMTENHIKKIFLSKCIENELDIDVLLIGSDERISNYRHCTPTDKKAEKVILLSPSLRKKGLHANISRMMCFGKVSKELRKKYDAVCKIQAEIIDMSKSGILFSKVFQMQKSLYKKLGYQEEWMKHMHGAPVGYMLSDGGVIFDGKRLMEKNQAYEWYITVTGAKSAELIMNIDDKIEILSVTGKWPMKAYTTVSGNIIELPDILVI